MPNVRVQNGTGGAAASRLGRAGTAEQAETIRTSIMGQRILQAWQQTMKAGFHSTTRAAMVRPHWSRDGIRVA
jgi:hypothetical protein